MPNERGSLRRRIVLALLWVCTLGCSDSGSSLLGPRSRNGQDSGATVPAPAVVTGCATFEVRLAAGVATAQPIATQDCGPVHPVLLAAPAYDSVQHTVTLSVGIENHGRLRLHTPAALRIEQRDVATLSAAATPGAVRLVDADSHDQSGYRWTVASVRPKTGQAVAAYLPPRGKSATPRTISIAVASGVTDLKVTLHAQATIVYAIAPKAARSTSERELQISQANVLPRSELAGRATRDALWLTFRPDATLDERQEALEAVDGVVIGGSILGAPNRYYIRIPVAKSSGKEPLLHAIQTLRALPQVRFATPDLQQDISTQYLRPKDQGDFASWVLDPSKAAKSNWGEEAVSAPLAWGCSTGDASRQALAIVDHNRLNRPGFIGDSVS